MLEIVGLYGYVNDGQRVPYSGDIMGPTKIHALRAYQVLLTKLTVVRIYIHIYHKDDSRRPQLHCD